MGRSQIEILIDGSQTLDEFIAVTLSTFTIFKQKDGGYISTKTMKETMAQAMKWGAEYQKQKGGNGGTNKGTEAGSDTASSP